MTLAIKTFLNADHKGGWRPGNNAGGLALFKALGHPLAAPKAGDLMQRLRADGPVAVYDPLGIAADFASYYDLSACDIEGIYVQQVEHLDGTILGHHPKLVTELGGSRARQVFIAAFDAEPFAAAIAHLTPAAAEIVSLDEIRLPSAFLSNTKRYLDPLNFATNFAFFRAVGDDHTVVTGADYWSSYGAENPALWLRLFDEHGATLAEWTEDLGGAGRAFSLDSAEIRERFNLPNFLGSLFMHAIRIKGHDVVKYALDVATADLQQLSCTHDANAWPADYYAGVPAPEADEDLVLWVQNSHPVAIPAGAIGVNVMGSSEVTQYGEEIAPFATVAVDLGAMLPAARWPQQIEIEAGRYFVRPRYEVTRRNGAGARRRIAHANVERTDLKPDPEIPELGDRFGKGFIMPLPVLPIDQYHTVSLPTPMATTQSDLPLKVVLYDATGVSVAEKFLGCLRREDAVEVDVDRWLEDQSAELPSGYGHLEFMYDFRDGGGADGWLHALGRYEMRAGGHRAETIFGAHIFNTPIVFRDEPQSYGGRPPGLTTRLFLRLGRREGGLETVCHLIYPASMPWHVHSTTKLSLIGSDGNVVSEQDVAIPCGGCLHWRASDYFTPADRDQAGDNAYVQIRDTTCRLFGYHGLVKPTISFCLDHMFGF